MKKERSILGSLFVLFQCKINLLGKSLCLHILDNRITLHEIDIFCLQIFLSRDRSLDFVEIMDLFLVIFEVFRGLIHYEDYSHRLFMQALVLSFIWGVIPIAARKRPRIN